MSQVPPMRRPIVERGMSGRDVLGFKREVWRSGVRIRGFTPSTPLFGAGFQAAVRLFQARQGLVADGQIGPITHTHLWPYGDAYAHWLIATRKTTPRTRLVAELRYLVSEHANIEYAELRPIPLARIKNHQWPVTTDCSGLVTSAFYAAGFPDPNGLAYNGEGYTGTLLSHLTHIPAGQRRAGDLVVFGAYPGLHVVALVDLVPADPTVFSHGHTGSPDDPGFYSLSRFTSYFAGRPITHLSAT